MAQSKLEKKWDKNQTRISVDKSQSFYAEKVEKEINPKSIICDLGGGIGSDAFYFLSKGHSVILCDISGYALKIAENKAYETGHHLDIKKFDLGEKNIPLANKSVNVVYSRLGLHYFNYFRTIEIFRDIFRILKDGGKAFVIVKSTDDKEEMDFLKSNAQQIEEGIFNEDGIIKSRFTYKQWEDLLNDSGIGKAYIGQYIEPIKSKNDFAKSGAEQLILTEIKFEKSA